MTDTTDTTKSDEKKSERLRRPGRLELRTTVSSGQVRQSFSHGRSKAVIVEVRRKRTFAPGEGGRMTELKKAQPDLSAPEPEAPTVNKDEAPAPRQAPIRTLTSEEKEARARALETALRLDEESRKQAEIDAAKRAEEEERHAAERAVEEEAERKRAAEEEAQRKAAEEATRKTETVARKPAASERKVPAPPPPKRPAAAAEEERKRPVGRRGKADPRRPTLTARRDQTRRRSGKLTINQALTGEDRVRSLASVRRARERERRAQQGKTQSEPVKVVREVVVPETISVQELANRMAVRGAELVKALMRMGSMVTINQVIDADTAELLVEEFGHKIKRVSAADVEIGLRGADDNEGLLVPRPPVVTVMGHVDHGKTSLLDALRETDVAAGEAGGITQHIGAYQVVLKSGDRITFIDTPGHAAFTAMRSRGAQVTDIVVLVVAADDGVMPQTVEAINHAKAAGAPIIVAINKIDRPDANPERVRNELLQYEIVVEDVGGDTLCVEVSALKRTNLDKLAEAILLQAELLDLKANPDRPAEGVVIEAKLDRGRGPVATALVQRGTLRVGDIVVAGSQWGRVRALVDERGKNMTSAGPSVPVEVLGLTGVPAAGDDVVTVDSERRAREVTEYRHQEMRKTRVAAGARSSLEQMFANIAAGETQELPVVVKADVQGSVEAIVASLEKLATDEVAVRVLHAGVGGINESDVTLAAASGAPIIGFNVRANAQAREHARRDGVEIRYFSVIYEVIDDIKAMLSGLLAPEQRERIVGNAQVLEVFDVTKIGKVAGCRVTDGMIRRGAKVRLLRDDTVIHEGRLSTLRRFKDDVREVKEGLECGMSFENYQDIRIGDVIEAVEVEEVARSL